MAYKQRPVLRNGILSTQETRVAVDSPAWFAWLDEASSFSFEVGRGGYRLTVRKEQRRTRLYWYAYLKVDAKLHNAYVGPSATLSQQRLDAIAQVLLEKLSSDNHSKTSLRRKG